MPSRSNSRRSSTKSAGSAGARDRRPSILDRWGISIEELTALVDTVPSLRGILAGYVAELKIQQLLSRDARVVNISKTDDHDRTNKGDRRFEFDRVPLTVECKSLQSNSVKQLGPDEWVGKTQVDASDCRTIALPDGSEITTTLLRCGEFDVLAVSLFAFGGKWRFGFARNENLPRSTFRSYTEVQRSHLIASLVTIYWPLRPPFVEDPFPLLEKVARQKKRRPKR